MKCTLGCILMHGKDTVSSCGWDKIDSIVDHLIQREGNARSHGRCRAQHAYGDEALMRLTGMHGGVGKQKERWLEE